MPDSTVTSGKDAPLPVTVASAGSSAVAARRGPLPRRFGAFVLLEPFGNATTGLGPATGQIVH